MKILSIETSCDETGLAIVDCKGSLTSPRIKVLKETLASQVKIHEPWGGVVPNLAKREHLKNLPVLFTKIFGFAPDSLLATKYSLPIDGIAVTAGPGLEPALWTGIEFAKKLSKDWKKPVWGVNHMEGHLFSVLLDPKRKALSSKVFPAIALIVSGGHTMLLKMESLSKWKLLGETRDDAAGEAFDKVARLLALPYPGGPEISRLALRGEPSIPFPQPMLHSKDYDFSFSGLKTAVLYYLRDQAVIPAEAGIQSFAAVSQNKSGMTDGMKADICASFEFAAVNVLREKTFRAVREFGARSVWLSGGVAANKALRRALAKDAKKHGVEFLMPDMKHNTDNGAMIGAAGYLTYLKNKKVPLVAKGDMGI